MTIPGVDALAAAIIGEVGMNMAAFGTAQRIAAWAGPCPAHHESTGKQKRRGTRKGDPYLKASLVTAAVCGARTQGTYLCDKFHRLRARMGAHGREEGSRRHRAQDPGPPPRRARLRRHAPRPKPTN